jgi:hypothetical protein
MRSCTGSHLHPLLLLFLERLATNPVQPLLALAAISRCYDTLVLAVCKHVVSLMKATIELMCDVCIQHDVLVLEPQPMQASTKNWSAAHSMR